MWMRWEKWDSGTPVQEAENEHAVDALIRLIGSGDGKIELVTLGPLTNIATAMLQAPNIMKKIPQITMMGGAHFYSNPHSVCAEFNIMTDPEAADVVFKVRYSYYHGHVGGLPD